VGCARRGACLQQFFALDGATGTVNWEFDLGNWTGGVSAPPVITPGGYVIAATNSGAVLAIHGKVLVHRHHHIHHIYQRGTVARVPVMWMKLSSPPPHLMQTKHAAAVPNCNSFRCSLWS
jgi:hypothetical protein